MTENVVLYKAPINPLIIIPARMASTRFPGKPLADINGMPMIVQVWKRAVEADIGPVVVACAEKEIYDAIMLLENTDTQHLFDLLSIPPEELKIHVS